MKTKESYHQTFIILWLKGWEWMSDDRKHSEIISYPELLNKLSRRGNENFFGSQKVSTTNTS